ncbi:MAG: DUF4062 domain-containing protein [Chloroflexota bacterium]|nr:DUF4062 domain-containing protein [Chloroflexota bacterium]
MKNRPPNVFVSSTMYDLSDLRAQLGQSIAALGWRPVMSEHDSFPIDPDQSTIENCRRNVRENAEIFVIAVGARYGSIDAESGKSVTNLEFEEARSRGVPAYVFVRKDVLAQLAIWKANPDADYSSIVDTPRIFEFIDSLRGSGDTWTFGFESAQDIIDTLSRQFAFLVQDALEVRQQTRGQDRVLAELHGNALKIALQRGPYWKYRLFATVLEEELDRYVNLRQEIELNLASEQATYVHLDSFGDWIQDRTHEAGRLAETMATIVNDYLPQALAKDGETGDPVAIAQVARRLAQAWEDNARWTLRCRAARVDERAERVVFLLSQLNSNMREDTWEYGHTMLNQIDQAIQAPDTGELVVVKLELTLTVDTEEFDDEFELFVREIGF